MLIDLKDGSDYAIENSKDLDLHLPDLSTFTYGPIEDLGALDASSVLSSVESIELPPALEEDIWAFPSAKEEEQVTLKSKSWECFYDKDFQEPRTVYISEGGPEAFGAALTIGDGRANVGGLESGRVIKSGPLLKSLIQLGLGRDSVLYRYDEGVKSFSATVEDGRMTGCSLEISQNSSSIFIGYGNQTKYLRTCIENMQNSSVSTPALVALAGSFSRFLLSIEAHVVASGTAIRSLLQLQALYERPGQVLALLNQVAEKTKDIKTDDELLSKLYDIVQDAEHAAEWHHSMLLNIFATVSQPWLESASSWLGLNSSVISTSQAPPHSFVGVVEALHQNEDLRERNDVEYCFDPSIVPTFIAGEDARIMFETGTNLKLLETHKPDHPLVRPAVDSPSRALGLEWQCSWEQIERTQAKAQEYLWNLQEAIREFHIHGENSEAISRLPGVSETLVLKSTFLSEDAAKAYISSSITAFERPLPPMDALTQSPNSDRLLWSLFNSDQPSEQELFAPPISLLPSLSFNSIISNQAKLVNQACLRLLFKDHRLHSHFSILHSYSLFGDGVFASRLSHALFDPEYKSAERRKGHSRAGVSGLKLGSRDTWPPASSELRLALMGILTDSYFGERLEGSSMFREELPGGLSFAIREMSEDELRRCLDPDSVEALDFLRLQYKAPAPVNAVITETSLSKYDAVFKLLLRAVRMLFVVNQLFSDAKQASKSSHPPFQRFRVESHHFVSAVCTYFFDGVQSNWHILEHRLRETKKALDHDDTGSLTSLRDFHEQVLEKMMFTLILRKRQVQVMKLLEEIFGLVLLFARRTRDKKSNVDESTDVADIHEKFKKKVRVFISVCRGLSERRGEGGTNVHGGSSNGHLSEAEGNTIGQLLLRLEMSGFYAR